MNFTDDEKLMLFLIWWHCEGLEIPFWNRRFPKSDTELNLRINENSFFKRFLSEAHEAKESYEFWVSDYALDRIKKQCASMFHWERTYFFKNKITITVG